ncbi:hypothetical protein KP509_05G035600 [Ceratopteris richardii]|uniref:CCHC-type domain-containing protein n=1 Tax=Ceratopteris richardii TaxID=49495 RepID=A0A8T2UMX8_CERRI|nr:hypothetical protein KP509_05G035600 [Ceratopteris richardii]
MASENRSSTGTPTGCFKCGRPGHWSRDCPSASGPARLSSDQPSSQQQKNYDGAYAGSGRPSSSSSSAPSASWKSAKAPLKPNQPKPLLPRKRPKLTPDLLLSNEGLGYVLEHFPRMVKIQGPGHEVEDLQSFLEAYVHWHSLILPYFSFNQFVEKVEKLGASRRVRVCINDLKAKLASGEELKFTPQKAASDHGDDQGEASLDKDLPPDKDAWDDESVPADVNEDIFDEFYKQATEEHAGASGLQSTIPSITLSTPISQPNANVLPNCSISEDQKLRMEANRLKALERAKARAAATAAS